MKAFFLSRLLREKVLLLAFVLIGAGIWLSSVSDRVGARWRAIRTTTTDLDVQQRWLSQRARIEKEAGLAIAHLDPSLTYDSVRLQDALKTMARAASLANYDVSDSRDQSTSLFAVHSVQLSVRLADIGSLVAVYKALSQCAPYISIEQFSLASNRANPAQLNISWKVTSVEIAK